MNRVEIIIETKDNSAAGFSSFDRRLKGLEDSTETTTGKVKEKFKKSGEDSAIGFGDGVDKKRSTLGQKVGSIFSGIGTGASAVFTGKFTSGAMEGVGDGLMSVLKSPAVLAVGAGLAGVLVPAIGAALSAGVLLGLGGGVLAAGVMAAVKAPGVDAALTSFKTRASDAFASFGKAFEGPTSRALQTFSDTLDRMGPAFGRIGASAAPIIDKLAPALAQMAERAMPGIEYAVSKLGPVFSALADELPGLGDHIANFFAVIADQGPAAAQFLKDFLQAFGWLIENTAKAVAGLTWVYGKIRGVDDASKDAGKSTKKMGEDFGKSAEKTQTLTEKLEDLTQKMLAAAGGQLSMRAATRAYEAALDKLSEAIRKGAHGIDEHTEKGRENAAMLDDIASAAKHSAEAARTMGQSNAQVTRIMEHGATQYYKNAIALGVNRRSAIDLTASIFGIPTARKTALEMLGAAEGKREIAELRAALASLHNRDVYVNVITTGKKTAGSANAAEAYRSGGIGSSAASGGPRAGQVLVGEDGPEIIDMNRTVYNAGRTRQMMAENNQGGGQGAVHFHIANLSLPNATDAKGMVRELQKYARENNGIALKGGVRTI